MQSLTPASLGSRALILILSQPLTEQKANCSLSLCASSFRNSSLPGSAAGQLRGFPSPRGTHPPPPLDTRALQHGPQAASVSGCVRWERETPRERASIGDADPSRSPSPRSPAASHFTPQTTPSSRDCDCPGFSAGGTKAQRSQVSSPASHSRTASELGGPSLQDTRSGGCSRASWPGCPPDWN